MSDYVCSVCKKRFQGPKFVFDGKAHCHDCYEAAMAERAEAEGEMADLLAYMRKLFSSPAIPEGVMSFIERLRGEGRKTKAMQATLWYYYEVQGHSPDDMMKACFAIRDNYEAARDYMKRMRELREKNAGIDPRVPPVTVKVTPSSLKGPRRGKGLTDISKL